MWLLIFCGAIFTSPLSAMPLGLKPGALTTGVPNAVAGSFFIGVVLEVGGEDSTETGSAYTGAAFTGAKVSAYCQPCIVCGEAPAPWADWRNS